MSQSELRHYCRKCRSRLKQPTDNPRRGFCSRFCFDSFYRSRCRVCEHDIGIDPQTGQRRRRLDQRKFCGRTCKNEARRFPHLYADPHSPYGRRTSKSRNPHKTGLKSRLAAGRAGRIVGPAHVLAVEVFGGRDWRPAVSSGEVAIEVGRLRKRTLVARDYNWPDRPVATNEAAHPEPRDDGLGIPASLRRRVS